MLSLLDILFPDATMNLVKKLSPMKTIQPSINLWDTPQKYNGWADWTTWNCALWIGGDEGLYNIAKDCEDYPEFLQYIHGVFKNDATPDGADWGEADLTEMNEMIQEISGL